MGRMTTRHLLTAATLLALALPAGAQAMKPGLWEINNKMGGGQMDAQMAEMQKQLARMPPEERKQMEAMMAQRGVRMAPGAGGGMAVQVCMTREMIERNEVPTRDGCTSTQQKKSGNTIRVAFTCTNPPSSGEGEVNFTPESYTSRMTVKTMVDGKSESMVVDATGKWLKADCGSVKPPAK
jgi:Protein of unknown function (DUF3617)